MACERCGASARREAALCRDCAGEGVPLGIVLVGLVSLVLGGATAFIGGSMLLFPSALALLGLVVSGLGIGQVLLAYGLWALKSWAWGDAHFSRAGCTYRPRNTLTERPT